MWVREYSNSVDSTLDKQLFPMSPNKWLACREELSGIPSTSVSSLVLSNILIHDLGGRVTRILIKLVYWGRRCQLPQVAKTKGLLKEHCLQPAPLRDTVLSPRRIFQKVHPK